MLTIKVSDEQQARLGIKSADEFTPRIEALLASESGLQAKTKSDTEAFTALSGKVEAMEAQLGKLTVFDAAAVTKEAVKASVEAAKIEAGQVATTIYGKSGSAPKGDAELKDVTKSKDAEVASDDYAGQYKASKNLQDEFMSEKAYVSFMKMNADGRIRISNTR